jgi:hypothetical protein
MIQSLNDSISCCLCWYMIFLAIERLPRFRDNQGVCKFGRVLCLVNGSSRSRSWS